MSSNPPRYAPASPRLFGVWDLDLGHVSGSFTNMDGGPALEFCFNGHVWDSDTRTYTHSCLIGELLFSVAAGRSKVRFRPSPSRLLSSSLFPRYPSGVTAQKLYRSLKGSGSSSNVLRIFWEISCSLSSLG